MKKATPLYYLAVTVTAASLLALPTQAAVPVCPVIVSHAAAKKIAPENTVAGIKAARDEQNVDVVEVDMRYTKSNYPYLLHDETLDRTTTATGKLSDTWVSDLATVSAADFAPWNTDSRFVGNLPNGKPKVEVPFVADFLIAAKQKNLTLLIDSKAVPTQAQADIFMSYVNRADIQMAEHILYMGSYANVSAMRGWYPSLTYGVIEYPPTGRTYTPNYLMAQGIDFYAVPIDSPVLTAAFVDYMNSWGVHVYTWTSDTDAKDVEANWQLAANLGVEVLITNNPVQARQEVTQCQTGSSSPASSSSAVS